MVLYYLFKIWAINGDQAMCSNNEKLILKSFDKGICTLTLNRERVYNAINRRLLTELVTEIENLRFEPELRVLVITGQGEKSFCSGADLKERVTLTELEVKQFIYQIRTSLSLLSDFPKPVIAAINGLALGGGTELALACDLRYAADHAKLGLTETKLAIIPGGGGTQRLSRLIGAGRAKELIFTAQQVSAQRAEAIGLVNQVFPASELITEVYKIAEMISQNGPIAIEQAKKAINRGSEVDLVTGLAFESEAYQTCIPTSDRIEGLQAFKEKRKPNYQGK